jgi:hypothetical protein
VATVNTDASTPSPILRVLTAPLTLLERTKGRKRSLLLTLYFAMVSIAGFFVWRAQSLRDLPDIGDPFDVRAASYFHVPDDENAYVLYRQACQRLKALPEPAFAKLTTDWTAAEPAARAWVDQNQEATELFRRGSDRPKALYLQPGDLTFETPINVSQDMRTLCRLALLEGSRREAEGDVDGAWVWYRAALRASRHVSAHGVIVQGLIGTAMLAQTSSRVVGWAENPRVSAATLRRAAADVKACEAMTRPFSELLKSEYMSLIKGLNRPDKYLDDLRTDDTTWYHHSPTWIQSDQFVHREPERSLRLTRLVFANWLAHVDEPASDRPPISRSVPAVFVSAQRRRAELSPEELALWLASTTMARNFLPAVQHAYKSVDRDRRYWGALEVTLAEQLYRREYGAGPRTLGELVGPFLDRLPEGFSADSGPTTTRSAGLATTP